MALHRLWVWALVVVLASCGKAEEECFSKDASSVSTSTSGNFTQDKLQFTLDLFHKLYKKGEDGQRNNLFFSPHSIHQALLLALFGAQGETEAELRKALQVGNVPKHTLIKEYKMENYFRETGCNASSGVEFRVANRLFIDSEEPLLPCVGQVFATEVEKLDLHNDTEGARNHMNAWVESQTGGKIKDLVGPLKADSRLAIVNSAYFKGVWEQQFKRSRTKLGLFYASQQEVIPTHMMYQKGNFRHGVSEELKSYILELPYEGESMSMFVLLPPFTPDALETTISRLDSGALRRAMEEMVHDSIEVLLPRFRLAQSMHLTSSLETLGVLSLFNQSAADLSGFSSKPGLAVEEAIHKSFIEVNEEGATAAAATALIGTRSGRPLEQTRFVCNHPFVFLIYDHCTRTILFIGALHKPTKASQ